MPEKNVQSRCRVAVVWIDWYAYHVARFRGLLSAPSLSGQVAGVELVGGIGVHAGLKFRENLPADLAIKTLMTETSWRDADKRKLSRMLWSHLSQLDPEVVLVPGYYTLPGVVTALWARMHGRASVLMTESTAGDHKRVWWKEWLKGLGLRALFNWAVTGGKAHVSYLQQLGFPEDRIVGFYDVVDNDMFRNGAAQHRRESAPASFGLPEQYFLYVGRLAEEKNVVRLFESWLAYREKGGTYALVLVGDGPERKVLEAAAAASPYAADVIFPGLKSSKELLPFYAFAGCFVLPSTREPWGLVVNEAMAASLPVIVSERCGCAPDLVHAGVNGWVFDPEDEAELADKLHAVSLLTAEERRHMGGISSEIIAGYSPQKFGRSIGSIANTGTRQGSLSPLQGDLP